MAKSSRRLKIVYTIPVFSQECEGIYARFHDVIHTLQKMHDPPWEYTIVPMRRYYGGPSSRVLFQDGRASFRLMNYLRNVGLASRKADVVHVVEGQFPYSLLVPFVVKSGVPLVAGPNVALGIDRDLRVQYWGEFRSRHHELSFRLSSIYSQNKLVFHRCSPISWRYKRVFMFKGYASLAVQVGGVAEEKLVCMPTGVRTDIFRPTGESMAFPTDFAILYSGDARRMHIKGFDVFLASLKHLKERGVQFQAYILGKTDPESERLVREHGLADEVNVTGFVPRARMASYYRGADAYVCSSRYEADSTTAVEALACGTPVVGTDVPGIEKTLSFKMEDGEDLAEKLIDVYENKDSYKSQLRGQSNQWDIRTVIEKWQEVYHRVATRH
jgi:glycosyltransferase involved in cell wall biosynthesis